MLISLSMINLTKLLEGHSIVGCLRKTCNSHLREFYKHQIIFSSSYIIKLETNAQFSTFYNKENKVYNKTQPNSSDFVTIKDRINKLHKYPARDLFHIYTRVNNEYDKCCISVKYKEVDGLQCTIHVTWPYEAFFSAIASSKKQAMHNTSILCLDWLYKLKKIQNLKPVLYSSKTIKNLLHSQKHVEINITPKIKAEIERLIHYYNNVMKSRIAVSTTSKLNEDDLKSELEDNISNDKSLGLKGHIFKLVERNEQQTCLPITNYEEEILNSLQNNQVILIKGDTGCGKSTQLPQIILDSYIKKDKAHECNIIVGQPRRISAVSLSHYVANQRSEKVGNSVGFHVRFANNVPKTNGSILFCTNGILLLRLNCNDILDRVSHIIIDEAHERSIMIDIILKLLKDRLKCNPHLKVIIMSATINVEVFQQYFSCPVINVPGKMYDVKMHFIDDIDISFEQSMNTKLKLQTNTFFDEIVDLIQVIITNKSPGGILCFVPGWKEIMVLYHRLENKTINNTNLLVLPLHSKLPCDMQQQVFKKTPANTTKIVLATDIAETGITIPDICYVIDTAIKRDMSWNVQKFVPSLKYSSISRANILQRKGRAGRLRPGESYHLITREQYNKLDLNPVPELLKTELDNVIINIKALTKEKIYDFFNSMISVPSDKLITQAMIKLLNLGILNENEELTSLGKRIVHMSLKPELSKAVALSCVFRCLNPILLLAIIFSDDEYSKVIIDKLNTDTIQAQRNHKKEYHKTSDHIAILKYLETEYFTNQDGSTFLVFKNSDVTATKLGKLYKLYLSELQMSKMISSTFDIQDENMNMKDNELIHAVLFAATHHLIKTNVYGVKKKSFTKNANTLVDEHGQIVQIKSESVNFNRSMWPNELFTYLNKIEFVIRKSIMVTDTSVISPLSVLLFSQGDVSCTEMTDSLSTKDRNIIIQIHNINNLNFICEKESAKLLIQLRSILWDIVDFILKYEGNDDCKDILYFVKSFKNDLINLVLRMLNKSSIHKDNESVWDKYFNGR